MFVYRAMEDELASIIFLDQSFETYPEPYRGHSESEIQVSFDVYKNFIDQYLSVNNYLSTPTLTLKYYLTWDKQESLCRCFYKDMAIAVAKEIWYAEAAGDITRITHIVDGADDFNSDYVKGMCDIYLPNIVRARKDLMAYMKNSLYPLSVNKTIRFNEELNYASLLYAMASFSNEYGVAFYRWSYERSAYDTERTDV